MASSHYLVFTLDDHAYALPLDAVARVLRAVYLTPVPEAPEILLGIINMGGTVVPVMDIRKRLRLRSLPMEAEDRIIVSRAASRTIAFIADGVEGLAVFEPDEMREPGQILPDMEGRVEGIGITSDQTVLIYDINRLFSIQDMDGLKIDADAQG